MAAPGADPARAAQGQAQSGRPTQGAAVQRLGDCRLHARGQQQRQRLLAGELQVGGAQLGQQPGGAQARQAQRRLMARGDGHRPALGQARQQPIDEGQRLRVVEVVQIVERDHTACQLGLFERVDDLVGGALLLARVGAGRHRGQCVGRGAPGQVERLQRLPQALQQAVQVVAGIQRDPRRAVALRQLLQRAHQQRRLAAAARCDQQNQPLLAQGLHQAPLQCRTRHRQPGAQPGALDLGAGDAHASMIGTPGPRWPR